MHIHRGLVFSSTTHPTDGDVENRIVPLAVLNVNYSLQYWVDPFIPNTFLYLITSTTFKWLLQTVFSFFLSYSTSYVYEETHLYMFYIFKTVCVCVCVFVVLWSCLHTYMRVYADAYIIYTVYVVSFKMIKAVTGLTQSLLCVSLTAKTRRYNQDVIITNNKDSRRQVVCSRVQIYLIIKQ